MPVMREMFPCHHVITAHDDVMHDMDTLSILFNDCSALQEEYTGQREIPLTEGHE